ncbi:MAG TPA: ATP phosphoribosyltransferase regulatory subunit, partial [Trueperaceae bacterium]
FQYCGKLWQALDSDMARTREYTQVGLELVGVSNARADAELIHLARESVREVGLAPRVEIGNAGFIRALFDLAGLPEWEREPLADAIDRKDARTVEHLLAPLGLPADLGRALQGTPDLYGHLEVLEAARTLAPWPETSCELDRLAAIVAEFEDDSELLLDLGMARRHRYYTGMVFRAYTFDFGQPLLGGGRYDGALLPYAAGFAVGLERLLAALPTTEAWRGPAVLSVDDAGARALRAGGVIVERALHADRAGLLQYARARGIPYLLSEAGLEPLAEDTPEFERLQQLLAGAWP